MKVRDLREWIDKAIERNPAVLDGDLVVNVRRTERKTESLVVRSMSAGAAWISIGVDLYSKLEDRRERRRRK